MISQDVHVHPSVPSCACAYTDAQVNELASSPGSPTPPFLVRMRMPFAYKLKKKRGGGEPGDEAMNEPAAPCAETWPIVNISTVKNLALNTLAYNIESKVDLKSTI